MAGNGTTGYAGDNGPATAAELNNPRGIVVDSSGDIFIADTTNNAVREINHATGAIITVAGTGKSGYSGDDGPATAAEMAYPFGVAIDSAGDLFIADTDNNRIREVNLATGVITTVAGNALVGYSGDNGPATTAKLDAPVGIVVDSSGNLVFSDAGNNRIREVNVATGLIKTVAGNGTQGYAGDHESSTAAELTYPGDIALDSAGNLFIDDGESRIREVNHATGIITTVAGNGTLGYGGDNGPATAAEFNDAYAIAVDAAGNLFIADTGNQRLREVASGAVQVAVVPQAPSIVVTASPASVDYGQPVSLTATLTASQLPSEGTVTFTDGATVLGTAAVKAGIATLSNLMLSLGNHSITASYTDSLNNYSASSTTVGPDSIISTVAGNGTLGNFGDEGQATAAQLDYPADLATDSSGDLFIADQDNNEIREVDLADGIITRVAGVGAEGYSGDNGQAVEAELANPSGIAVDSSGDLFIADTGNNRIREVNHATGTITTVAGTGANSFSGDNGPATAAMLDQPSGVALDPAGDLFIADTGNQRIRKINHATGVITTVAGNGLAGYSRDHVQATATELDNPQAVAVDSAGDVFVADTNGNRIREVNHYTGLITTVAGNGTAGYSGDNRSATAAELDNPEGVAFDAQGDLLISDSGNDRIREVNLVSGTITTMVGNGSSSIYGDLGQAGAAAIGSNQGLTVDSWGDLFIAEPQGNLIREAATGLATVTVMSQPTTINLATSQTITSYGQDITLTAHVSASLIPSEGAVTFMDGAIVLGTAAVTSGTATLSNFSLGLLGTQILTASYNDSPNNFSTSSTSVSVTVFAPTSISVAASPNVITYGQTVNVTATVSSAPTPSEGTVTFMDGATVLGTSGVFEGVATLQNIPLPVGTQHITASYSDPSNNYTASSTGVGPSSIVATMAGSGDVGYTGDNGAATAAALDNPTDVAVDSSGNLFFADTLNNVIREVNHATGVITTVAGNGTQGYAGDGGPATAASLDTLSGIGVDSAGDLFIADTSNNVIREVNHVTGVITTVAGNGSAGYSGDNGPATAAELASPTGIVLDSLGDLFFADSGNCAIREVNLATGLIATVAGNGVPGYSGDNGPATAAELHDPVAVALDSSGDLFIADTVNYVIREVNHATGAITTVAGNGKPGDSGDHGPAIDAEFVDPNGVAVDSSGDLLIADTLNNRIRAVSLATGTITTVAGNGSFAYAGDNGAASAAEFDLPEGIALDSSGDLFIADRYNNRVREISYGAEVQVLALPTTIVVDLSQTQVVYGQTITLTATVSGSPTPSEGTVTFIDGATILGSSAVTSGTATLNNITLPLGSNFISASYEDPHNNYAPSSPGIGSNSIISTVAGNGVAGYSGSAVRATNASLNLPRRIAIDSAGNLFIADSNNNAIREVNRVTGIMTTIAGNGAAGYSGDNGPATAAQLDTPEGIALDSAGDIYIGDTRNNVVREVNHVTGIITTVAGNRTSGNGGDNGPATAAELALPAGIAVDSLGDIFIPDTGNNRIREVNQVTGVITTVAGDGTAGHFGDNSLATAAWINDSLDIALDSSGNLYISDTGNNDIREVNYATGTISTVVGDGQAGYSGDNGPAIAARLNTPTGILVTSAGDLFIADFGNSVVREVNHITGVITSVVGNGTGGYNGDGLSAVYAELKNPEGLALDPLGNLFIADVDNDRIREVSNGTAQVNVIPATSIAIGASQAFTPNGQTIDLTATVIASQPPSEGTVTFKDGNVVLGTAAVSSGTATLNNVALPAGNQVVSASYADPLNLFGASSTTLGPTSIVSTWAGNGTAGHTGDNGPATAAELDNPVAVAADSAGNVFVADSANNVIREVNHATGAITSMAGNGTQGYGGDNGPATAAQLDNPNGIAVDSEGDLLIADSGNGVIREVNHVTGMITTLAGGNTQGYGGDNGPATAAQLRSPDAIALDSAGDLFIADTGNNVIREVNVATGVIATVAGNGIAAYGGDNGPATAAELSNPHSVALDSVGDLFIADSENNVIREVMHSTGVIVTVAGNGTAGYSGDNGPVTAAQFDDPLGILVDASGDLFIADTKNNAIREVTHATAIVTTLAGNEMPGYSGDNGPATAAQLDGPRELALDSAGDLLIADAANNRIREVASGAVELKVLATTTISVISSQKLVRFGQSINLTAAVSASSTPSEGTVTFMDNAAVLGTSPVTAGTAVLNDVVLPVGGHVITASYVDPLSVDAPSSTILGPNSIITSVAGNGGEGCIGDGGQATAAAFYLPSQTVVDSFGNLFIVDDDNNRIREVSYATGVITTVAGNGILGYSGDNVAATATELNDPNGVALDLAGDLFIADTGNNRVREVNHVTGVITTVAGTGTKGFSGDYGPAVVAELGNPVGIALDSAGDLFIADFQNNRIREVNHITGAITTVAGNGIGGYAGDTGQATAAELDLPAQVALDSSGNLFIADRGNNRIREVTSATGVITTVAGNGLTVAGNIGDNDPATAANLNNPYAIALDSSGDLFIADTSNNRIREVNNTTGVIITVAGNGTGGYGGDNGQATAAKFEFPTGVALDAAGDLLIADLGNGRIREISSGALILNVSRAVPTIAVSDLGGTYAGTAFPAMATVAGVVTGVDDSPAVSLEGVSPTLTYYAGPMAVGTPLSGVPIHAGIYTVVASFAGSADYAPAQSSPLTFTITPAPLTITANNQSITFGATLPTLTANYTGFVGNDASAILTTLPTLSTTATVTSPASGSPYPITVSGAVDPDYTITYVPGQLTIMTAPTLVSVSASSAAVTYGQTVTLTATVSSDSIPNEGTVTFMDGAMTLGSQTVSGGTAVLTNILLPAGAFVITAAYNDADGNYADGDTGAGTNSAMVAVNLGTPVVAVSDFGGIFNGSPFSSTATVAGVVAGVDNSPAAILEGVAPTLAYYSGSTAAGTPLSGAPVQPGTYTVVASFPGSADYAPASSSPLVIQISAAVVTRALFDHDSYFDGFNTTTTADANVAYDSTAIATDKTALLPGGTATFANVSSFTQGVNGVIVDIAGSNYPAGPLPAATIASDFAFQKGNSSAVGSFTATTAPASITVFKDGGVSGSDRLEMIWAAGTAVSKGWLEVTINPSSGNNLPTGSPDIFYFGSDPGDTYTSPIPVKIGNFVGSAADELNSKGHFVAKGTAAITDIYDFNRDGQVNSLDQLIARAGETNKLAQITTPAAPTVLGNVTSLSWPQAATATGTQAAALVAVVADLYAGELDSDLLHTLAKGHKK